MTLRKEFGPIISRGSWVWPNTQSVRADNQALYAGNLTSFLQSNLVARRELRDFSIWALASDPMSQRPSGSRDGARPLLVFGEDGGGEGKTGGGLMSGGLTARVRWWVAAECWEDEW